MTFTILVVDDDPNVRFTLEETLRHDGYEVIAAENGEAAMWLIEQREFDLVLIDLKMKRVSGLDVLRLLRQRAPGTAAIVLTAYASLETAVEALRQGAHDYLFKPAKTVELRESVRAALLKRRREQKHRALLTQLEQSLSDSLQDLRSTVGWPDDASPVASDGEDDTGRFVQHGNLIVDMTRHIITLDGKLLELSPTEFDLLAYLVSEMPRVVTPLQLVQEVQGYASERWEASEVVRQHIYRIRAKIREATGRNDVIRTVRGVGYTIHAQDADPPH